MAALLLASTSAFVSKPVSKPQLRTRQPTRVAPTAAMPQVVATAVAAIPKAVCALKLPTIRQLAAAPALYALMSINEYFTHKYYQHAEFNTAREAVFDRALEADAQRLRHALASRWTGRERGRA